MNASFKTKRTRDLALTETCIFIMLSVFTSVDYSFIKESWIGVCLLLRNLDDNSAINLVTCKLLQHRV